MNLENSIERLYRELNAANGINCEYTDMYSQYIDNPKLQMVFSTMHFWLTSCFSCLNQRLPTGNYGAHFWAEPSRDLIRAIELADDIIKTFKTTKYTCNFDEYYKNIISQCKEFLSPSGGSSVPPYFEKIELYYTIPIFTFNDTIIITSDPLSTMPLKYKAGGSYADVSFYFDKFYAKNIAVKTAHKNLNPKELERFRKEFDTMRSLNSPYIIEVYFYDENRNRYTMEYVDITLKDYVEKNNNHLTLEQKKTIINQILYAFKYLHSKRILHRDISPKNVLIKQYDDLIIVKISDFGLVKIPESALTSASTEIKGCFNDPSLYVEGFSNYTIVHETYALTRLITYVLTGKTNVEKISDEYIRAFIEQGLNPNKNLRFKNVDEIKAAVSILYKHLR